MINAVKWPWDLCSDGCGECRGFSGDDSTEAFWPDLFSLSSCGSIDWAKHKNVWLPFYVHLFLGLIWPFRSVTDFVHLLGGWVWLNTSVLLVLGPYSENSIVAVFVRFLWEQDNVNPRSHVPTPKFIRSKFQHYANGDGHFDVQNDVWTPSYTAM